MKKKIDLSDIMGKSIDDTANFTKLVDEKDMDNDIEDMVNEKKRNTKDLTKEVKEAKEKLDETKVIDIKKEDKEVKEEKKVEKVKKVKKEKVEPTCITDIGVLILVVISYFIYCLLYTNFYDNNTVLLINSIVIILTFVLYAFAIIFNKRISKILVFIIFFILLGFVGFNLLNSLGFKII